MQLSHSAISRFQDCPKSYELHYKKRWRERVTSGALVFGSAMDQALNAMLLKKKKSPQESFDYFFRFAKVGQNESEYIPTSENITYASSDFDADLLKKEDFTKWNGQAYELGFSGDLKEFVKMVADLKKQKGWANLLPMQRKLYNLANWLSLRQKAYLMLDAYKTQIIPKIKKVLAVQKRISLENGNGDTVIGFVDLVVEWHDGSIVIFDNKTSSIEYDEKAAATSPQLTLYVHALEEEYGTRHAGFIVLRKGILKNKKKVCSKCFFEAEKGARHKTCNQVYNGERCDQEWVETIHPEVDIQTIIQEVPERSEEIVMENFDEIAHLIQQGIFTRNLNSCKKPWGLCSFYDFCWSNDDSGLDKLGEKDEAK